MGALAIAANDILTSPSHVVAIDAPPTFITAYNVMKQEYCGARLFLFEALEGRAHFADRDVLIYDTLEYASHSIALERGRCAYRIAFSVLDKVGDFLNEYFELGRPSDRNLNLRNVWGPPGSQARKHIEVRQNWPLCGLYLLSMDIRGNPKDVSTDPQARALADLRHATEHRFVVIHEMLLTDALAPAESDTLLRIERGAFERRAVRMLQLARSALT